MNSGSRTTFWGFYRFPKKYARGKSGHESADKTQVGIQITFLKDGQKRYLSMIQPWGKDGIWVPAEAKEGK